MNKFMVYDTASQDILFHESLDKAQKDYEEAISMIEDGDESGHKVYIFEMKSETEVVLFEDK